MNIPKKVLNLFDDKLNEMHKQLLIKIANDYSLNEDELFDRYLGNITIVHDKNTEVKTVFERKHINNSYDDLKQEDRCIARTWAKGYGGQCKYKKKDKDLCQLHLNLLEKNKKLKYGIVTDINTKPGEFFWNKDVNKQSLC